MGIRIVGVEGLPEIRRGDDLAALILQRCTPDVRAVVVVAQKIVSKAEGAEIDLRTVDPSERARAWAVEWRKDARLVEVILRESRRIVKMERGVIIAETRHGFVAANAGVDQSNVPGEERVTLLPADPDASARRLRERLGCGAVIVCDTFGRPWREGLVNVAIGVAGFDPIEDWRGRADWCGKPLSTTTVALADELAAAAGLAMRKDAGIPVALVEGLDWRAAQGSARRLIRDPAHDLFR